jgi:hypothetical protein
MRLSLGLILSIALVVCGGDGGMGGESAAPLPIDAFARRTRSLAELTVGGVEIDADIAQSAASSSDVRR